MWRQQVTGGFLGPAHGSGAGLGELVTWAKGQLVRGEELPLERSAGWRCPGRTRPGRIASGRGGLFRRRRAACRARYRTCDPCELTPPRPARLRCDLQRRGGDEMTATDQDKGAAIVTGASRSAIGVVVNYAADA